MARASRLCKFYASSKLKSTSGKLPISEIILRYSIQIALLSKFLKLSDLVNSQQDQNRREKLYINNEAH